MRWKAPSDPPLAGDSFLSNWSARPLANLVDKIQKTMPFNLPGSLSRPAIDRSRGLHSPGRQVPRRTSRTERGHAGADSFPAARNPPAPAAAPRRARFHRRKETSPS